MRCIRGIAKLGLVCLLVCVVYAGYKLDKSRRDLERYKRVYGYATPTVNVANCTVGNRMWEAILIDSAIAFTDGAHNIEPFDIDGDGDLELVANAYRSDALMVYDSPQGLRNARSWVRHTIDCCIGGGLPRRPACTYVHSEFRRLLLRSQIEGAHYTAIADLSGDGREDLVVAGDLTRNDVTWFEAVPDTDGIVRSWRKHVAYRNDAHRTYHVETGDIDGDGDLDIVFTTKTDNSLGWLENRGWPGAWPAVIVDPNCTRCFYARAADVDNDGRTEIVASEDDSDRHGRMCLYMHAGNPRDARDWTKHHIAQFPPRRAISVFQILDLDGDGAPDIAGAGHQGDICLLKNPSPGDVRQPWPVYFVTRGRPDFRRSFREIDVGDIDLDGDLDIVVADEMGNAVWWFENPGTTFSEDWPEHLVDRSDVYLRWCHCVRLGDVDKDGDLDIAVAAAASNVFLLYLNRMGPDDSQGPLASQIAAMAGNE